MLPQKLDHLARPDRAGDAPAPSRRGVLAAMAALGGGLLVGFREPALAQGPSTSMGAAASPNAGPFAGYLRIAPDGRVTVLSAHMDMGQGIYHGIATLVMEELDGDWSKLDVEGGWGNTKLYGNVLWGGAVQGTGGSTGIASSYERYRKAGAIARVMLTEAAAAEWGVPVGEVGASKGTLTHASGRSAGYGDFAAKAAGGTVPGDVALKPRDAWTVIGKDRDVQGRYDSRGKSTGAQDYTIDVRLPGMLVAVPMHPPLFGAKLKSFDAAKAKALKGVVDVVAIPSGLAVVAGDTWTAMRARDLVVAVWDETGAETRGTDEIMAGYRRQATEGGAMVAAAKGDAAAALGRAAKVVEATFEFPYLAHAALEPLDAVVRRNEDGTIEVWGGHQLPDVYQGAAAEVAGVTLDKVRLHVMKTGGSFGRRAVGDADVIVEAVATAKALGWRAPVKMQWTREDDTRGGRYRPAYVHALKAGLDAEGNLVAWRSRIVGQSIARGTAFAGMLVKNGVDLTSVEGAANLPYAVPDMTVELVTTEVGIPVLWWRAVGSTHTAYAVEAFLDEVAAAAGKDPVAFRLALLKDHPRHAGVLRLAAEKAGWGGPAVPGRFRGVAVAEAFGTYVAQVAEVSLRQGGGIKVERVVCAVDCGTVINPDQVRAQMEGGIGFGLGAILKSRLTLDKGRVVEGNFDAYDVLRIDEMPSVEVHIVPSTAAPTGVGEPGVPPIGPAVANAAFQATGKRVRVLPFTQGLTA